MSRPKLKIDENIVAEMALSGCPNTEIALVCDCDPQTIANRFSELIAKKRAERRWNLRKEQNKLASEKNATMLIWLGKNELGQRDMQTVEHTSPDGKPVEQRVTHGFDHKEYERLFSRFRGTAPVPIDDANGGGAASSNGNGKSVHP